MTARNKRGHAKERSEHRLKHWGPSRVVNVGGLAGSRRGPAETAVPTPGSPSLSVLRQQKKLQRKIK